MFCDNEWGECYRLGDHKCTELEGHNGHCRCVCGAEIDKED